MNDISFTQHRKIPVVSWLGETIRSLSLFGKLVLGILIVIFAGSGIFMLSRISSKYMVEIPEYGGSFSEGIIGLPRFVNPVLAVTDGDKDTASLVYSGLLRQTPDGTLQPDLAESIDISDDGTVYAVRIKPNAIFQDGTPVTADDVIFTIQKVQDPEIKSPKKVNWDGVSVERINDREIRITLPHAYAPFIENLALGILPKHLWSETNAETFATSQFNVDPIGSGPYRINSISKDKNGSITEYELASFDKFVSGRPEIKKVTLKYFSDGKGLLDSYLNGNIDSINGISPMIAYELAKNGARIETSPLPRVFGVFFNQSNNAALAQKEVRQALDESVDRQYIIDTVLRGYGSLLAGPVTGSYVEDTGSASSTATSTMSIDDINKSLDKNGWVMGADGVRTKTINKKTVPLAFSITTSDAEELKEVGNILVNRWKKIGADVTVKVFEGGYLNQDIIKPRNYEALLFGQVVNRDLDLYAFWHSSQVKDPGLNIALYSNKRVDTVLETLRITSNKDTRLKEYQKFKEEIGNDVPAVFLYSPDFIYVAPKDVKGLAMGLVSAPSERFASVANWYIYTDNVWKIFVKKS